MFLMCTIICGKYKMDVALYCCLFKLTGFHIMVIHVIWWSRPMTHMCTGCVQPAHILKLIFPTQTTKKEAGGGNQPMLKSCL